jgi:hypothetical protein
MIRLFGFGPFSIMSQLRPPEIVKNADNFSAFLEFYCKIPKLRTWVRFPSPAPETFFTSDILAIGGGGKRRH